MLTRFSIRARSRLSWCLGRKLPGFAVSAPVLLLVVLSFGSAQAELTNAPDPMLFPMEAAQLQETTARHAGEAALVFTESREFPIRRLQGLPARWLPQTQAGRVSFTGQARPGEFYVFQIGVYALKDTGPLAMTITDLTGDTGAIPASAGHCLSLGGIDHRGQHFTKEIRMKQGQLQALWVGVAVPPAAKGAFTGTAQVRVALDQTIPVSITLNVEGSPVPDHGDSVARNLSRLRWLDSTVGSEATLTQPFTALQTEARVIRVLGRELALSDDGLPARVTSHFSPANTQIETAAREVLARPVAFAVETSAGLVSWRNGFGELKHTDLEASWTARSTADGLHTETSGRLDYTGSGEVRVRLIADREMELKDARLEVPIHEDAARYFAG
jgi:hypothetical protein